MTRTPIYKQAMKNMVRSMTRKRRPPPPAGFAPVKKAMLVIITQEGRTVMSKAGGEGEFWNILAAVNQSGGAASPSTISSLTGYPVEKVVKYANMLANQGYVTLRASEQYGMVRGV